MHLTTAKAWQPTGDWLDDWATLETHLFRESEHQAKKIIFALDEYEMLHTDIFRKSPDTGGRLLAAIRSFLQRQNRIVFLLIGSAYLDELENPRWSDYFVQAQTLTVDYLSETDSKRLITEPVKNLQYPAEVVQQLYDLTQGHPHLLQLICQNLVNYANRDNRRQMTQTDLDKAVEIALDSGVMPQSVFWTQFCEQETCRETVRQIINQEPPSHREALRRLKRHAYIVQDNDKKWKMRVPLFAEWVRLHDIDL